MFYVRTRLRRMEITIYIDILTKCGMLIRVRSNRHSTAKFHLSFRAGSSRLLNDWPRLDGIEQVRRGSFSGIFLGMQG